MNTPERQRVAEAAKASWRSQPALVPLAAIVLALAIGAVVILLVGNNPLEAYAALLRGMFGSPTRIAASLADHVPDPGERERLEPALLALLGVAEPPAGGAPELFWAWRTFSPYCS